MAFSPEQLQQIKTLMDDYVERVRPEESIRAEIDIGWRHDGQSIYACEIRPDWRNKSIIRNFDFAKATWVKRAKEWRIYWMRGNGDWYRYEALESVGNLRRFVIELEQDPHGCFHG